MALAQSFGIEFEFITPGARRRAVPDAAHRRPRRRGVDPRRRQGQSDRPHAVARQGRAHARRADRRRRRGDRRRRRRDGARRASPACASATKARSDIALRDRSSTAPASGRAQFGALAGVNVPLYSAEHFYIVTDRIDGVHPMLPVMRDPDGFIYYKEEVGGLVMGGFEPVAKPWTRRPDSRRPSSSSCWARTGTSSRSLMTNAIHRTPCLETAEVKMLLNGPESFTLDGNFILGEAPELRGYFVCAGFNSAGIANSGGAGRLIAEWIVGGERADRPVGRRHPPLRARSWPTASRSPSAPARRSACTTRCAGRARSSRPCGRCAARRSTTGSRAKRRGVRHARSAGSAPTISCPAGRGAPRRPHTLGTPDWLPYVIDEQRATREARRGLRPDVVRARCCCKGRDALAVLQRLCANEIDVAVGPHGLHRDAQRARRLRERPHRSRGSAADTLLHRHRLGAGRRATPTGSSGTSARDEHATLVDVTRAYSVLSVMGPNAQALLARVGARRRLGAAALPFSATARDRRRLRPRARGAHELRRRPGLRALRADRDGAPRSTTRCTTAGAGLGLARRRLLRHRRAAHRGRPARLGRRARARRDAVRGGARATRSSSTSRRPSSAATRCSRASAQPPRQAPGDRSCFDSADACAWGGEALLLDGEPVGEITPPAGARRPAPASPSATCAAPPRPSAHDGTPVEVDLWGERVAATAWDEAGRMQRRGDVSEPHAVLAALDRGAGVRAVAAVRPSARARSCR